MPSIENLLELSHLRTLNTASEMKFGVKNINVLKLADKCSALNIVAKHQVKSCPEKM